MEKFEIKQNISALYVEASSFPKGVDEAFTKLAAALVENNDRQLYGISHPNSTDKIIYRAAAKEAYPGEGQEKGLQTFLIKKGTYISTYLTDWKKDESSVGKAFEKLLSYSGIDPKGYCLEIYDGANVRCLVPII